MLKCNVDSHVHTTDARGPLEEKEVYGMFDFLDWFLMQEILCWSWKWWVLGMVRAVKEWPELTEAKWEMKNKSLNIKDVFTTKSRRRMNTELTVSCSDVNNRAYEWAKV